MSHKNMLIMLLLMMCGLMFAQTPQINISCAPSEIFVNNLSTGAFDPINPQNQPILTNINIRNTTQEPFMYSVKLNVKWNEIIIVNEAVFASLEQLQPGSTRSMTNRDFIRQDAGVYFAAPSGGEISISSIIDASPVLRDAIQSGFFPDGTLTFEFIAYPRYIATPIESLASFSIRIKNITNVFLTYPGRPIGENPPEISASPITFLWNAMGTQYNMFQLKISEFPPNQPPDRNNVETTGKKVVSELIQGNIYSEFQPFQDGYYYAWQVSTGLIDENDPYIVQGKQETSQAGIVQSEWFVFRYSSDAGSNDGYYQELLAYLNMLNNSVIKNTFAQGYKITGAVFYEDQAYTGKDAVDLVKPLIGREIEVELTD